MATTERLLIIAVFANLLMGAFFVYGNYSLWELFRGNNVAHATLISSAWNPFTVNLVFHDYVNGNLITVQGIFTYPNTPFMLFWVSTIVNLFLMMQIHKRKETPSKRNDEKTTEA